MTLSSLDHWCPVNPLKLTDYSRPIHISPNWSPSTHAVEFLVVHSLLHLYIQSCISPVSQSSPRAHTHTVTSTQAGPPRGCGERSVSSAEDERKHTRTHSQTHNHPGDLRSVGEVLLYSCLWFLMCDIFLIFILVLWKDRRQIVLVKFAHRAFGLMVVWNVVVRHSFALASTQSHLKRPVERFLQNSNSLGFDAAVDPTSHAQLISFFPSHSLSLARLIIVNVEQSAASQTKLHISRQLLELEPFCWHVGRGIEAVRSSLDGLRNQVSVLINLKEIKGDQSQLHSQLNC